jgi:gamma-glutamylcyclotransferase (GGCT)/AIG2-like uncharacterized protein YtfP
MMQALALNSATDRAMKWGFIVWTPRALTGGIVAAFCECFDPQLCDDSGEMPCIFVYGTLKRGLSNAAQLDGAVFERVAATASGYALHMVSGYPAMSRSETGVVHGELYIVSDEHLRRLDEFEGVPEWYQREVIALGDGTEAEAYVVAVGRVQGLPPIVGGMFSEPDC